MENTQELIGVQESKVDTIEQIEEFSYEYLIKNNILANRNFNKKRYYPMIARQKKWEGVVILKLYVDMNGHINEIILTKSSGYKILDDTAVKTVKEWKLVNNYKKKIYIMVPIEFKIQ